MKTLSLITAALFLTIAASASASIYAPPGTAQALPTIERIAAQAWPGSPCEDSLHFTVVHDLRQPSAYDDAYEHVAAGTPLDGDYVGNCEINISDDMDAERACDASVHEAGHAAGQPHTDNPHDVMYIGGGEYGPCHHDATLAGMERLYQASQFLGYYGVRTCALARRGVICRTRHRLMDVTFHGSEYPMDAWPVSPRHKRR